jgi:hypothetical protein
MDEVDGMSLLALAQALVEALEQITKIDVARYTRVRAVVELNFDPARGTIVDVGLETRYRRELKK